MLTEPCDNISENKDNTRENQGEANCHMPSVFVSFCYYSSTCEVYESSIEVAVVALGMREWLFWECKEMGASAV